MTATYNKDAFDILKAFILKDDINWSLVWELPQEFQDLSGFEISRFDNKGDRDPFEKGSAYINVEEKQEKVFREMYNALLKEAGSNITVLGNLFVVYWSLSSRQEYEDSILKHYKEVVGADCLAVYNELIQTLNTKYYAHHHYQKLDYVLGVEKWLDVFRSAQYFTPFHDPVIAAINLVREERNLKIEYQHVIPMKPILRAVLMEWYNFEISSGEDFLLSNITNSLHEAAFVAATILDDMAPDAQKPKWLDADIVRALVLSYWPEVGSRIFLHVFGSSYRNKNKNPIYTYLKQELKDVFIQIMNDAGMSGWDKSLEFPNGYIAFFGWARVHGTKNIPEVVEELMRGKLIDDLEQIVRDTDALIEKSNKDIFTSYNYGDFEYQNTFPYLLWLLLGSDDSQIRRIEHLMFDLKPFFFGGFTSTNFAKTFVEFILLTLTSITQLSNINDAQVHCLKKIIDGLCKSVMVPYVHLVERNDEIWDPLRDGEISFYSLSVALINMRLQEIEGSKYKSYLENLFEFINSVKVAQWPFERISNLRQYYTFRSY